MRSFLQKSAIVLTVIASIATPFRTNAGLNDVFKGWSWTPNVGWIAMNSTNTNAPNSYGVTIDDSRNISGWAWSSTLGWICFGYSCSGNAPGGGSSWAVLDNDPSEPQIYGWARIHSLYVLNPAGSEGWISLNCSSYGAHPARNVCGTSSYRVSTTTNGSLTDGQFQGYGWSCMTSDGTACTAGKYASGVGWVHFDPTYTPPPNTPAGTYSGVPWIQVLYGDLYSKGSVSTPSPFTSTFKQVNATYCIDSGLGAAGVIHFTNDPTKCASGSLNVNINLPKRTTNYSNVLGRIKLRGYSATLVPDTAALLTGKYGPWQQIANLNTLPSVLGGRVYDTVSGGDWTISAKSLANAGVGANGSGLLIVRGNLTITGNIDYQVGLISDLKRLASLGILVLDDGAGHPGNITIDPAVTNISANIYAEGTISTGSTNDPTTDQPLVINGVVVARQFKFQRVYPGGVGLPAEQILNDGRIVVNTPPGMNDFIASLPSVSY